VVGRFKNLVHVVAGRVRGAILRALPVRPRRENAAAKPASAAELWDDWLDGAP
jgi:hypothetical protein